MEHTRETAAAYDRYPEVFDEKFERHMREYNLPHADAFLAALPGRRILDIGSGPGNHSAYFRDRGFEPLCGDPSEAMLRLCRMKGLRAEPMTLETFDLGRRFDGVWANASLLHLRKSDVPAALSRIDRHLCPGGAFGCDVKEGRGEGMEANQNYPGTRHWFSYFADEELRDLLAPRFELLRYARGVTPGGGAVFLKYVLRLRGGVV